MVGAEARRYFREAVLALTLTLTLIRPILQCPMVTKVRFVENGDNAAPAANGQVAVTVFDLQVLDGRGDVVFGDVARGGGLVVGGVVVEDELCWPSW